MQFTPNYNLKKPEGNEKAKIADLNENFEEIDRAIKEAKEAADNVDLTEIEQEIADVDARLTQHLDNDVAHNHYGVATGTNALIVTLNPAPTSLTTGMTIQFKNTTANTGNVTVNANGLGAKPLLDNDGNQISSGKLKANSMYSATYDGVNFYLTKGGGGGSPIKRIQRIRSNVVFSNLSATVNIQEVNLDKAVIRLIIQGSGDQSTRNFLFAEFVSNTQVTITRSEASADIYFILEVIEFEDNVIVQSGKLTISTGTAYNIPIQAINASKSLLFTTVSTTGTSSFSQLRSFQLTDTHIETRRNSSSGTDTMVWYVVTFQ